MFETGNDLKRTVSSTPRPWSWLLFAVTSCLALFASASLSAQSTGGCGCFESEARTYDEQSAGIRREAHQFGDRANEILELADQFTQLARETRQAGRACQSGATSFTFPARVLTGPDGRVNEPSSTINPSTFCQNAGTAGVPASPVGTNSSPIPPASSGLDDAARQLDQLAGEYGRQASDLLSDAQNAANRASNLRWSAPEGPVTPHGARDTPNPLTLDDLSHGLTAGPDGHSESALDLGGLLAGETLGPSASQNVGNQHNDFTVDSAPIDLAETGGYDPEDELDELGNGFLPEALRGVLDETLQDDETSEARGNDAPATPESDENEERSLVSGRIECVSVTMNVTRISCESPGCPVFENVCTEGLQVYYYLAGDIGGTGGFSLAPGEVHDTWRRVVPGARVVFAACPISVPYPVSDNGEFWGQRNPGRFLCRGGS